jgi:nucleoid-associated protein YgaU
VARGRGAPRWLGVALAVVVLAAGATAAAVTFALSPPGATDEPASSAVPAAVATAAGASAMADPPTTSDSISSSIHVVRAGDTLRGIAAAYLGDEERWQEILELNRDRVPGPEELRVGVELRLPAP